jgi:RNA polymerase sigma-70 factor (ECF subfamily)
MSYDAAESVASSSTEHLAASAPGASLDPRLRTLAEQELNFVWRLLRRMGLSKEDADDATQEIFLVGLHRLAGIAPGSERAFLIGTAIRVVGTQRRSFARRNRALARLAPPGDPGPTPEQLLERRSDLAVLDGLLESFPFELRSVFVLFELEEVTESDIARALDLPRGTVASRLRRARKLFQDAVRRRQAREGQQGGAS